MGTVHKRFKSAKFEGKRSGAKSGGSGKPIMCPIETYIRSSAKKHAEASVCACVFWAAFLPCPKPVPVYALPPENLPASKALPELSVSVCALQPKPAFCTLATISVSGTFSGSNTMCILFVVKLTSLRTTPSIFRVTRSTAAEQAAQDIPSIINVFLALLLML